MKKEIPAFIFNGFLGSGKTTLIKQIISDDETYQNFSTLIISFESGEVEYDLEFINKYKVNIEYFTDGRLFNNEELNTIVNKYKPKQIIFELNSFTDVDFSFLPFNIVIYQQITLFDTTSFEMYYNNMKGNINLMVKESNLVVFNRCVNNDKLSKYRRSILAFNQQTQIAFELANGKMTTILDEDLPYDISKDKIEIEDDDYPTWYIDTYDNCDKYKGKTICMNVFVRDITTDSIIVGRQIMTCCEADIQFYGFECLTDTKVKIGDFIHLECEVIKSFSKIAKIDAIMLKAKAIKILPKTEEHYLVFK